MSDANSPLDNNTENPALQSDLMHLDDDNVQDMMLRSKIRGMSRTKKIVIALLVIGAVALSAFGYYRWSGSQASSDYLTMKVTKSTITNSIEATGTLEPVKKSEMGFKNDGAITAINVNPGDKVVKGQVLAQQDPTSLQTSLEQAQNTVDQDIINVKTSTLSYQAKQRNYEQQAKLQEAGATAQSDLDTARDDLTKAELELATAKSKLSTDQIKVAQARSDLEEATLIAPFDGMVGAVNGQVGQLNGINSSTSTLLTVMSENLQLTAQVNEADIGQVQAGQTVEFTSTAYSNKTFSGQVVRITPEAQTVSNVQYYPVLISCSDPERLLKSGMTVSAEIIISRKNNVVTVPMMAVSYAQTYLQQQAASSEQPGAATTGSNSSNSNSQNKNSSTKSRAQTGSGFPGGNGPGSSFPALASGNGRPGMVLLLKDDQPVVTKVTLGLSDESNYQVISGLAEGDQVVVGTSQTTTSSDSGNSNSSNSNSNRSNTRGGMGGGMGGPPPGM